MRPDILTARSERVVVADGATGTMLQAADLSLDDFEGHEGCNEMLNVTRPDVVATLPEAYFAVGADAVETNTFGADLSNLGEYGIADRIHELAEAGARIAREVADGYATVDKPRYVIGSVGPGTKLPTLGHAPYAQLRDAYQAEAAGLIAGGVDAILIETAQDLLQAKAAIVAARRAMAAAGRRVGLFAQVTVELTGQMLLGSEIGAALTALEPLGIDHIGLNCATGPTEMSEHLRYLSEHARIGLSCMPNAGRPALGRDGATDPLTTLMDLFEGVETHAEGQTRAEELAALPLGERLERRIVDGERTGLAADLDEALADRPPLQIINETLLAGMKTVGELFGSGQMQLPFVLQPTEVMKAAVAQYSVVKSTVVMKENLLEMNTRGVAVELSEEFQLVPEQSTSAIVAHHPEAKYFAAR